MTLLGTSERPLRVAIIGSGPSGFYAAESLFKGKIASTVDMFERLPTPYGLVRGGVAPDHLKIRQVRKVYDKIALGERFNFLGNVEVGTDITVNTLQKHYDAIIFAFGTETDQRLNVPGEDLPGSHRAAAFVGWYNGHPDHRNLFFDLSQSVAVVIGMGNVALDVARILARTVDELKHTDIAQHALDALAESKIRNIYLIGRRGPAQAKFTPMELKEIGELEDCDPVIDQVDLALSPESREELDTQGKRRMFQIMQEFSQRTPSPSKRRRLHFRFMLSPVKIKGSTRVESIVLGKNVLEGPAYRQKSRTTGEILELPCGLVFRSIGYRGMPIPGIPFDDRWGTIPNIEGRVVHEGKPLPGLYAAGWIKRGPSGVIGTNKPDAVETVSKLLEDAPNLPPCEEPSTDAVRRHLAERGVRVVDFQDWQKIDAAEEARGKAVGKPREQFTRIPGMLAILDDDKAKE